MNDKENIPLEQKDVEIAPANPKIFVVFPYKSELHSPESLKLAIRSLANIKGVECIVAVVGDKEDWFGETILHIPSESPLDNQSLSNVEAACLALTLEETSSSFILMQPDTFILQPINLMYLLPKVDASGVLGCGLPVIVDSFELSEYASLHEDFTLGEFLKETLDTIPVPIDWQKDNWVLPVVSENPNMQRFAQLVKNRIFLKCHTWPEPVCEWLKNYFPEPSSWEA